MTGKIYWVLDDFKYFGNFKPKINETKHFVSRINFAIIKEHMIKIQNEPDNYEGKMYSYNINLNIEKR